MTKRCIRVMILVLWAFILFPVVTHAIEDPDEVPAYPDVLKTADEAMDFYIGRGVTPREDTLADVLLNYQITITQQRNTILHFCDAILHKKWVSDLPDLSYRYFIVEHTLYDPRQSYFVYSLCVNVDEKSIGKTFAWEKYKERNYKDVFTTVSYPHSSDVVDITKTLQTELDLNEVRWIPRQQALENEMAYSACDPATSMQACKFSRILPTIFKTIMNDITNLRIAAIYGYEEFASGDTSVDILQKEKNVLEKFATSYFGKAGDTLVPCNDAGYHYLYPDTLKGDKAHCSHPKTAEYFLDIVRGAKRLTQKTKLLVADEIFPLECHREQEEMIGNVTACALSSYGSLFTKSDTRAFQNLYLNELMRYTLFVDFYSQQILSDPSFSPLTFGSYAFNIRKNQMEAATLGYEQAIAKQAAFQTMRLLSNFYTTFPVHIGLHAYREDIVNYRHQLTKVYTPLHQLYYTLRNAQSCQ